MSQVCYLKTTAGRTMCLLSSQYFIIVFILNPARPGTAQPRRKVQLVIRIRISYSALQPFVLRKISEKQNYSVFIILLYVLKHKAWSSYMLYFIVDDRKKN